MRGVETRRCQASRDLEYVVSLSHRIFPSAGEKDGHYPFASARATKPMRWIDPSLIVVKTMTGPDSCLRRVESFPRGAPPRHCRLELVP